MYIPGCPPRPDQLIDGIFKLREEVWHNTKMGAHREAEIEELEQAALAAPAKVEQKGLMR